MKQQILTLFTRTPLHVGAGNSVGAIDSPVMRERHTRIPVVPGSSLKGVLADLWKAGDNEHKLLFGTNDNAGKLLIGEARVLAFPLRSGRGSFAWVTCPLALNRFKRDSGAEFDIPKLAGAMDCAAGNVVLLDGKNVILEEYCFNHIPAASAAIKTIAEKLLPLSNDAVWSALADRLVLITDEMFSYFVENACEVVTRIRINDETGVVEQGKLFNQEQVPSETMLYAVISSGTPELLKTLGDRLNSVGNQLQLGGDETIGLGYCSTKMM